MDFHLTSCWVSCDVLASRDGLVTSKGRIRRFLVNFKLGFLWCTSIPSGGSSYTPSHFMLGVSNLSRRGYPVMWGVVILLQVVVLGHRDRPCRRFGLPVALVLPFLTYLPRFQLSMHTPSPTYANSRTLLKISTITAVEFPDLITLMVRKNFHSPPS